ncbi:MAG: Na+ dependent nucleoside transporter N-terminal domain-containing protein, partial [Robiginitalea sp.]|nr:Na+ dependent nucleoside transporter N-terminal domain-containing protein [Robiginitalea sp.]
MLCLLWCLLPASGLGQQTVVVADSLLLTPDTTLLGDTTAQIIPNQGFSLESFGRGVLGLAVVLAIAFAFSARRRRINWRTVAIGLGVQLILAIGILKVPAVQWFFNLLGEFFNSILEFTLAGSTFVFGSLMDLENPNIGYVFAFQILPTIIFFSALTSVLYYLG